MVSHEMLQRSAQQTLESLTLRLRPVLIDVLEEVAAVERHGFFQSPSPLGSQGFSRSHAGCAYLPFELVDVKPVGTARRVELDLVIADLKVRAARHPPRFELAPEAPQLVAQMLSCGGVRLVSPEGVAHGLS
jgi:hypothetical protein